MDTKLLKQKILDLAIRGKLVPQDPNDEPASVLLERIRAEREKLIAEGKLKRTKTTSDNRQYENQPFEIPPSWEWCRISDYVHTVTDFVASGSFAALRQNVKYYKEPNYALMVKTKDFQNNFTDDLTYTDQRGYEFLSNSNLFGGELVLSNVGSIGKVFIVPYLGCKMTLAPNSIMVRFHNKEHIGWFYNLFLSSFGFSLLQSITSATAIGKFNKADFKNLVIPIPPLEEQKKIVKELERWNKIIDDIDTDKQDLLELVKQAKSRVLDLAIHGKLVPQDPSDEPAIELLKRINPSFVPCDTSHYGQLPKSWCVVTLGTLYNHTTGKALKKSNIDGVLRKYITTSNLYWNFFDFTEVRSMYFTNEELEKCTVHKGDLLVCNGGDVGRAAVWSFDDDICIQNHISRLRPKYENVVNNKFFCYIFMYLKQKGLLNGKGVAITSLSARDLLSLSVPLPPIIEQNRIIQEIQYIEEKLEIINTQL